MSAANHGICSHLQESCNYFDYIKTFDFKYKLFMEDKFGIICKKVCKKKLWDDKKFDKYHERLEKDNMKVLSALSYS